MLVLENKPHIKKSRSTASMMLDVIIALVPVLVMAIVNFGWLVLRNVAISLVVMILSELVFVAIKNKVPYDGNKHSFKEHFASIKKGIRTTTFLVPIVTGLIFSMIMPLDTTKPGLIYVVLIVGALFGEVIGKLVFGGLGKNIFNPAAVGMVFAKICFGQYYAYPASSQYSGDVVAGATPLTSDFGTYSLLDMFLGRIPGVIGETCKVAILVGFVYLLVRRTIDWKITVSYLGIFAIDMLFVGIIQMAGGSGVNPFSYMLSNLLMGGIMFSSVFMATDPVTSPTTNNGKLMYGALLAGLTAIIRLFASAPDGVIYSLLLANMATWAIDYHKFANPKYTWKNILVICLIAVIPLLIIIWVKCVEVF